MMNDQNQVNSINLPSFDEKPIGTVNKFAIPEYAENEQPIHMQQHKNPQPQPLAKRLASKVLKIRKEAFQELLVIVNENPQELKIYENQSVECLKDSAPIVQNQALKVVLAALNGGCELQTEARVVIKCLIEKALTLDREEIKNNAASILYWYMDHQAEETLLNELNDALLNKNPKIVGQALIFITLLLNQYGIKRMKNLSKFDKNLEIIAAPIKPIAKQANIELFKEIYRWFGENTLKQFKIQREVKDQFIKFVKQYEAVPMEIKRGLKKEQIEAKKTFFSIGEGDESNEGPMDVLVEFSAKWVDDVLAIEKWKEKKIALEEFIKKTKVNVIMVRQTSHYITLLKRLINDNNINLLQCAFSIIQNLSKGLRRHFSQVAKNILSYVFFKLKDGKTMIVSAAQQTLKSLTDCLTFQQMIPDIKQCLDDKVSNMKVEVLKFLKLFAPKKDVKAISCLKGLLDKVVKLNQDGSELVRNAALDWLCTIKKHHDMKFFGDKLKHLSIKKMETLKSITTFDDTPMEIQETLNISATSIAEHHVHTDTLKCLPQKDMKPTHKKKEEEKSAHNSAHNSSNLSEINVKSSNARCVSFNELNSENQNVRLKAYNQILIKPSSPDIFHMLRSKASKESSPAILKVIIQIVKKYAQNGPIELEPLEFLCLQEWKKCKAILQQFISTSKFTANAEEYIKAHNLRKEHMGQKSNHLISNSLNLKMFFLELQNLLPKMSHFIMSVKIEAAEEGQKILENMPRMSSQNDLTQEKGWNQQAMMKLLNVLKCRLCENEAQILSKYCKFILDLIRKGLLAKTRTIKPLMLPILQSQRWRQNVPEVNEVLVELTNANPIYVFALLAPQIINESSCESLLDFLIENNAIFIKFADLTMYMIPLLQVIAESKHARCQEKSQQLLNQIIQLRGASVLEEKLKKNKISFGESFLAKWNITLAHKPSNHENSFNLFSKNDRLKLDSINPWPISITAEHIYTLANNLRILGDPFLQLNHPYRLNKDTLALLKTFQNNFINEYSDILFKWIFWRVMIDQVEVIQQIFKFGIRILLAVSYNITQTEVVLLLGAMLNACKIHHRVILPVIYEVNRSLCMIGQEYKQKSFRFWIYSLTDPDVPSSPIDETLQILINCYSTLLQPEMVGLARIPEVINNTDFSRYAKNTYDGRMLNLYGFKNTKAEINKQSPSQQLPFLSASGGPQSSMNINPQQIAFYYELFQKSSSNEMACKIDEICKTMPAQLLMDTHLKIMYSIFVPFLKGEIPCINVYTYIKDLNKILNAASINPALVEQQVKIAPYLLQITRSLLYLLIDLDQNGAKIENYKELLKLVNKNILNLLEFSEAKHILQILFLLLKKQLKQMTSTKLTQLMVKCILKVTKYSNFLQNLKLNLDYLFEEMREILTEYSKGNPQESMMKLLRTVLNEVFIQHREEQVQYFQQYLQTEPNTGSIFDTMMRDIVTGENILKTDKSEKGEKREKEATLNQEQEKIELRAIRAMQPLEMQVMNKKALNQEDS